MVNPQRARILLAALASKEELDATIGRVVAAVLRNDGAAVEEMRARAHELLDEHIDLKIEGIGAIRADINRQYGAD